MKPTILDAYAFLLQVQKEAAYETVRDLLAQAADRDERLLMVSVNLGEVYYRTLRQFGSKRLREVEKRVGELPLEVVPADMGLARQAALLKATHRMSYADCFAAALAKARGGRVVTGDREFEAVEDDIEVLWL